MNERFYLHIPRFLSKVTVSSGSCWNWNASKNQAGYGQFVIDNRKFLAHRLSYQFFKGDLKDLNVLHECDNKLCVNPLHLFLGTQSDNMLDREAKGRANKHKGKQVRYELSPLRIHIIRKAHEVKLHSIRELATRFNLSYQACYDIIKRRTWKHV